MSKKISVVVPVFNEEKNIENIYKAITNELKNYSFEIVFINDGSTDQSSTILDELSNNDSRVKVISFTRNFGHQAALTAGIDFATGDAIISMDCDFQDPPELIPSLVREWENGYKIVYARRSFRNDPFLKKITAQWYYSLLYKASEVKIKGNIGDYRLIDKSVAVKLRQMRERSRYLRGLVPWLGYSYAIVDYVRPKRAVGKTKFNWLKMLRFAMNGLLNFSLLPLRIGLFAGIFIIFSGIIFLIYLAYRYFFDNQFYKLLEWLAVVNYILIGTLFIFLWFIAEYIGKIYEEVKGRPLYIIQSLKNIENNENSHAQL
ncbi:MAG: glycosyltransferase family 2 protein [Bacteroidales bacterium]|nr:glycosyltransferase family 2 protein [Bacteroidales bacterium]